MDKNGNQILTATCTTEYEDIAASQLLDRSLLYNRDKKDLNIIVGRKAIPLTAVDSNNIVKNEKNQTSLKEDITIDSVTTRADHNGVDWKSQSKVAETNANNSIYLLFKQETNGITLTGSNGHIVISEVGNHSLTVSYNAGKRVTSCKLYISGGNQGGLILANQDMTYEDGVYSYTVSNTTYRNGAKISICVLVNSNGELSVPQGILGDMETWAVYTYDDTKQTTKSAVIGGEILEVGEGIYGHYQISLTNTGSRLIKGATTFSKKAKYVLAIYKGERYYGIKFKSEIAANIYFAGWQSVDESLLAPAYTEYEDSDLSDIIELDDDSDTGTQVIDDAITTFPDTTWEFLGDFTTNFQTAPALNDDGYYDYGSIRIYPSTNGDAIITQEPRWNSVVVEGIRVTPWRVEVDQDNASITFDCKNWLNTDTNIVLYGANEKGEVDYTNQIPGGGYISANPNLADIRQTYTWNNLKKGLYWIRQGSGSRNTKIEYYNISVAQDSVIEDENWTNGGSNTNYDFGNGLLLTTNSTVTWSEGPKYDNRGIISVAGASDRNNPLMTLTVNGPCVVHIGASRSSRYTNSRIRITESLDTSSAEWAASIRDNAAYGSIGDISYKYTGTYGKPKDVYFINEDSAVDIYYVRVEYPALNGSTVEEIIDDLIENLENTGEDGSPHIIRLSGTITKSTILAIAENIRSDSNKQITVDLSRGTMEAGYTDWTADTDLTKAFIYCVGLRAFYYPHNVTTSGAMTFMHCSFLREVHFNPEMVTLGAVTWQSDYVGVFAGSRIKTIFLPATVTAFAGYTLSDSNIINIYCERGSSLTTNYCVTNSWAEWSHTRKHTFYFPTPDYNVRSKATAQYGQYANKNVGIDLYIQSSDYLRDYVKLWENYDMLDNPEFEISYTD